MSYIPTSLVLSIYLHPLPPSHFRCRGATSDDKARGSVDALVQLIVVRLNQDRGIVDKKGQYNVLGCRCELIICGATIEGACHSWVPGRCLSFHPHTFILAMLMLQG